MPSFKIQVYGYDLLLSQQKIIEAIRERAPRFNKEIAMSPEILVAPDTESKRRPPPGGYLPLTGVILGLGASTAWVAFLGYELLVHL
jgi:hypothetical protein